MSVDSDVHRVRFCSRQQLLDLVARLQGLRVTLMGLGLFGGGVGAARFLAERCARVTVTDLRNARQLGESIRALDGLPVEYRLGGHDQRDFREAELVVAGPGVPRTSPHLRLAAAAGVPITSPMNIFLALCKGRVAAVTGSNGKSTTTALLAGMCREGGRRVWLGGNIGISLLPSVDTIDEHDLVVLELSSFQLQDAATIQWSPHVAVVTNITPNHLDRHGTFADYVAAKKNIVRWQGRGDFVVLNAGNEVLRMWTGQGLKAHVVVFGGGAGQECPEGVRCVDGRVLWCSKGRQECMFRHEVIPLPGHHNVENAMAAAAAARLLGIGSASVQAALRDFVGLEHRLELVGDSGCLRYYNDSYSTTPESTVAAIDSFPGPIALIAGGYDKKLDTAPIAAAVARRAAIVVTIGQTGPRLARQCRRAGAIAGREVLVREAEGLRDAVQLAGRLSPPGTSVLFSPGCASYDMFENCRERGRLFRQVVLEEAGNAGPVNRSA